MFNPDSTALKAGIKNMLPTLLRTAATTNGSAVDLLGVKSGLNFILDSGAATVGTLPTLDVKIQDSADGSTGWADVTGMAFAQVTTVASAQVLGIANGKTRRYVRAVATIGGSATPTFTFSVNAVGVSE